MNPLSFVLLVLLLLLLLLIQFKMDAYNKWTLTTKEQLAEWEALLAKHRALLNETRAEVVEVRKSNLRQVETLINTVENCHKKEIAGLKTASFEIEQRLRDRIWKLETENDVLKEKAMKEKNARQRRATKASMKAMKVTPMKAMKAMKAMRAAQASKTVVKRSSGPLASPIIRAWDRDVFV